MISARAPDAFAQGGGKVVRLFPDYRAEEERFFKKTGIFPIMHLMTMRRAAFEQHPWIAMNLFKAFEEAKHRSFERVRDFTCARIPLPWAAALADEIIATCGPDPYPYGIEASRPTIDAFCRYCPRPGRHGTQDDRRGFVPAGSAGERENIKQAAESVIPGRAEGANPESRNIDCTPILWISDRRSAASGMTGEGFLLKRVLTSVDLCGTEHGLIRFLGDT